MDRIRISGGRKLNGTIPISGAKNATLPLMIASLLTDQTLILDNVPRLADVGLLQRILGNHGVDVMVGGKRPGETAYDGQTLHISAARIDGMMRRFGMPLGPLEVLDRSGLDVVAQVAGSVAPLADDRFVLIGPGDELTAEFDAGKLPPVKPGYVRSFVLRTHGYCKDSSLYTATSGDVSGSGWEIL